MYQLPLQCCSLNVVKIMEPSQQKIENSEHQNINYQLLFSLLPTQNSVLPVTIPISCPKSSALLHASTTRRTSRHCRGNFGPVKFALAPVINVVSLTISHLPLPQFSFLLLSFCCGPPLGAPCFNPQKINYSHFLLPPIYVVSLTQKCFIMALL
jgi:hypothetical protein